jgi:hypothetical protein
MFFRAIQITPYRRYSWTTKADRDAWVNTDKENRRNMTEQEIDRLSNERKRRVGVKYFK